MARLTLKPQKREFTRLFQSASANAVETAVALARLLDEFPADTEALVRAVKDKEHDGRQPHAGRRRAPQPDVRDADRSRRHLSTGGRDRRCLRSHQRCGLACRPVRRRGDSAGRAKRRASSSCARRRSSKPRSPTSMASRTAASFCASCESSRRRATNFSGQAVATLFRGDVDPVDIIRWKDIHERLEDAVDACENAADVLEAIFVKNR